MLFTLDNLDDRFLLQPHFYINVSIDAIACYLEKVLILYAEAYSFGSLGAVKFIFQEQSDRPPVSLA
ncbi:MAG: hypothetical protein F6K19_38135 [Cyanothece sp. SIO1E1]|nr:hypothetical protein [Cyanothece sp. SIO1E1]